MARVYLDTSFVSACVATREDTASVYRRELSRRWLTQDVASHQAFVSLAVLNELSDPAYPTRDAALRIARQFPMLPVTPDASGFAEVLIREFVMPQGQQGDALHVALCCVHRVDILLSWNVRHLANPNKMPHLRRVCARVGYLAPDIITPDFFGEQSR